MGESVVTALLRAPMTHTTKPKAAAKRANLTEDFIRRLPVRAKPYRVWDTKVPGLFVRVQPTGIKSYNVHWSRQRGAVAIGKFPHRMPEWARNQAHKIIADAHDHGVPDAAHAKAKVATFNGFVDEQYAPWVTAERKSGAATVANLKAQFAEPFGTKPLSAITAWDVERFKAKRLKDGIAPATVNRDLDRIRALFSKAVEWKLLPANPVATVKRSKGAESNRVRYLDAKEEKRLRTALLAREAERRQQRASANQWAVTRGYEPRPMWAVDDFTDHLTPIVLVALNTGLRRGELLGLTWEHVSFERKQLTVAAGTAKSGKVRYIPLNAEAVDALKRWRKYHGGDTGFVFAGADGARMGHFNRSWRGIVKAADLDDFHFHDCRHTFASRLVMAGVDLYVVKELLGHADFAMTQRYAHLSPEHKAAAVALLVRR